MKILAIESSCDETAAAVIEERTGRFSADGSAVGDGTLRRRAADLAAVWGGYLLGRL